MIRRPPAGLRLRDFEAGDAALYAALFADPAVWTAAGAALPADEAARAATRALAHQQDPKGRHRHWVIDSDDGALGLVALQRRRGPWQGGEAEIGLLLAPAAQRRGVGIHALREGVARAFDGLGLDVLHACHRHGHRRASALVQALGFLRVEAGDDDAHWHWRRRARGSLACVGVGMMLGAHLTPRARGHLEAADRVFALVSDALVEHWLASINPRVETLQGHYAEGKPRPEAYRGMVEAMLAAVRRGERVVGAFYGHPGVFARVPHAAIAAARAEGFAAVMEPGISAEDCLYADLGIDPGDHGCVHYEATQLLIEPRRLDTRAVAVIWQVGLAGDRSYAVRESTPAQRQRLVDRLRADYPDEHPVILYEAATLPIGQPRIETLPLARLAEARMGMATTAVLAPCPAFAQPRRSADSIPRTVELTEPAAP